NTKSTSWWHPWIVSTDEPYIYPGEYYDLGAEIKTKEIGEGYFIPVYYIKRGYTIPLVIQDFVWNLRFQYENLVTTGFSFFVFINDPKNLSFPLVNVIQNEEE
ncbi:MAG: hypothetical protein ABIL68_15865, partial [bacterium]